VQRAALWLVVLCCLLVSAIARTHLVSPMRSNVVAMVVMRGGSTAAETTDDGGGGGVESDIAIEQVVDGERESEAENEDAELQESTKVSNEPARLLVHTNLGNSVLDHRLELTSKRSKTLGDLKKSISRLLPGRPPLLGLELVYEGRILNDNMLIHELYGDDEDDEDEDMDDEGENQESFKVLTLNSVPPVDPKFAVELAPKLRSHVENDEDTLTTEEILDAYFLNQAVMAQNARRLDDPTAVSSPLLRLEIQEQAMRLKEKFRSEVPEEVWQSSLEAIKREHHVEEIRGQRYRSGKGGARTSLKKSIQTNLNIVSERHRPGPDSFFAPHSLYSTRCVELGGNDTKLSSPAILWTLWRSKQLVKNYHAVGRTHVLPLSSPARQSMDQDPLLYAVQSPWGHG
jgi:hypothetical protein